MRTFTRLQKRNRLSSSVFIFCSLVNLLVNLDTVLVMTLRDLHSPVILQTPVLLVCLRDCDSQVDISYTSTSTRSSHAYCLSHSSLVSLQHTWYSHVKVQFYFRYSHMTFKYFCSITWFLKNTWFLSFFFFLWMCRSLKRCDTSVERNEDECMLVKFTLCHVLSDMVDLVIPAQPLNKNKCLKSFVNHFLGL